MKTKKSKAKSILLTFTNFFAIIFLCFTLIGISYTVNLFSKVKQPALAPIQSNLVSKIYDHQEQLVTTLNKESVGQVTYDDLPDVFINALLSTEDVRFFLHNGLDIPRLLSAIYANVTSSSFVQGASTLTQQLVKNTMLNSNKTIKRKLEEAYLANRIEKLYSKKDILEFYANYICFDGINPGVNQASLKYFNKKISSVTLPEAALLVGMVNLPTYYNPFKNPIPATTRRNEVLDLMVKHHYLSNYQAALAKSLPLDEMLYHNQESTEKSFPFQAYLDIVYEQVKEYSGYDPYTTPMHVYTYLDATLQSEIDLMQQNQSSYLHFDQDLQQFAATVINNENGAIIAAFGGRNYNGKRLFNRAYDMVRQPASTIKPLLSYALAYQYLNWSNMHCLVDTQTFYPNTNQEVHNVDRLHMGELMIDEAIGYSRNTTAVQTLYEVAQHIGMQGIADYLENIHLLDIDKEKVSYAYALGAFAYGVSPTNLAAAYAMLANQGIYKTPLAVKKIVLLKNQQEIIFNPQEKRVLDADSVYLLNSVLENVMKKNFWNINVIQPNDIHVSAKTGTSSFDETIIKTYNYPANAYKDRWLAGYSKNISIAAWTGFDNTQKDQPTYFTPSSNDANIVKLFFKRIMDIAGIPNQTYDMPENIVTIPIVKGSNPYLLPTNQVNKDYVINALFKRQAIPTNYICEPQIDRKVDFDYYVSTDKLTILIPQNFSQIETTENKKIFDYEKIYGEFVLVCELTNSQNETFEIILKQGINDIPLLSKDQYTMKLYYKYQNGHNKGPSQIETFEIKNSFFGF